MTEIWESFSDKSLADVLRKNNASRSKETHVATLGIIVKILREFGDGYGEAEIQPIPLYEGEDNYTIKCVFLSDNYSAGDTVLAVFTDFDFRTILKNGLSQKTTTNKDTHSRGFGILVRV